MQADELEFGVRKSVNWGTVTAMVSFHLLAVAALFYTTPGAVAVAIALHWICGGWGICMGYHRLLTHRSFKVAKPIAYFLAVCGTLTLQGGPIFWTAVHRVHHQKSDVHRHSPAAGGRKPPHAALNSSPHAAHPCVR